MTETTNDLINKAFYLINVYSPNEYPKGYEVKEALDYLNEIIDGFETSGFYIPYNNDVEFNTVPGQATYIFGQTDTADVKTNKFVEISDAYVKYGNINYPLMEIQHDEAFQIVRYPLAMTRPTQIFLQNTVNQSEVTLYSTPDMVYDVIFRVKQVFNNLTLNTTIDGVPKYYIRYLRYALAKELTSVFETNSWNDVKEGILRQVEDDVTSSSDTDWSLNLSSALRRRYIGLTKGSIIAG